MYNRENNDINKKKVLLTEGNEDKRCYPESVPSQSCLEDAALPAWQVIMHSDLQTLLGLNFDRKTMRRRTDRFVGFR